MLLKGEVGIEFTEADKAKVKIGDGTSTWAQLDYFGGEGGEAKVFQVIPQEGETDIQAITRVVDGAELHVGDQAIVKRVISATTAGTKYAYTAYVYDGAAWTAMDGNYNADNVYFNENLTATYPIGKYTIPASGSTTIPAEGKSLKAVLNDIIAEEKQPEVTKPTGKFVSYTGISSDTVEPGTKRSGTVYYELGLGSVGSYTYGPTVTGVEPSGYSLKYQIGSDPVSAAITTKEGQFDYNVTIGTSNITIKTTEAKVSHTAASNYAKTNIGTVTNKRVEAGTVDCTAKTNTFTSKRKSFWAVDNNIGQALTNNNIRNLAHNEFGTKTNYSLAIPADTKRVIIAVPGTRTMKSCIDVDGMGLDVKDNFTSSTVNIGGADSTESSIGSYGTSYTIFLCENGSGLKPTTYNITLQ